MERTGVDGGEQSRGQCGAGDDLDVGGAQGDGVKKGL